MDRMFYNTTSHNLIAGLDRINQDLIREFGFQSSQLPEERGHLIKNEVMVNNGYGPFVYYFILKDREGNFTLEFSDIWHRYWNTDPFSEDSKDKYNLYFPKAQTMAEGSAEQVFYFLRQELTFMHQVHPEIFEEGRIRHLKALYRPED